MLKVNIQTYNCLNILLHKTSCMQFSNMPMIAGTIFGIRIRDQTPRPSYQPQYNQPNLLDGLTGLKANALRLKANALRFKVGFDVRNK